MEAFNLKLKGVVFKVDIWKALLNLKGQGIQKKKPNKTTLNIETKVALKLDKDRKLQNHQRTNSNQEIKFQQIKVRMKRVK